MKRKDSVDLSPETLARSRQLSIEKGADHAQYKGSGYSWDWVDDDFTFEAHKDGLLIVIDREEGVRKERKFATATQARAAAEQYYAERRPLAVLAREGESRKEPSDA
jgi:hypothetical protein